MSVAITKQVKSAVVLSNKIPKSFANYIFYKNLIDRNDEQYLFMKPRPCSFLFEFVIFHLFLLLVVVAHFSVRSVVH